MALSTECAPFRRGAKRRGEALREAAAVMYSVTVLRARSGPGAIAHRLRTDALASSRQCPHSAANPGTRDLPFRTIPAVADQFRQGSKGTANAVWVNSPSGVQIPEPPPLTSGFPWWIPTGKPLFLASLGPIAHGFAHSAAVGSHRTCPQGPP